MVKLIASDLDGTLLKNGAQELNTTVFQQILALRENGIYFVAASGRQYENLRRLFAPVKDDISYIAENGSLCIHKGNILARGTDSERTWQPHRGHHTQHTRMRLHYLR